METGCNKFCYNCNSLATGCSWCLVFVAVAIFTHIWQKRLESLICLFMVICVRCVLVLAALVVKSNVKYNSWSVPGKIQVEIYSILVSDREIKVCISNATMQNSTHDEDGYYKTSFSVFVAILYLKVLYILVMTLYVLSRFNPTLILAAAALGLLTLW